MEILAFIPVWRRLRITELCYIGLTRLIEAAPKDFTIQVLVVLSEEEHIPLAEKYGFNWVMTLNSPLGLKFNVGLKHALDTFSFDYLFQLNSDNLISNRFWDHFEEGLKARWPATGVDRVYFYDSATGSILNFRYFGGCGIRFLSRKTIEKAGWHRYVRFRSTRAGLNFEEIAGQYGWIPESRFDDHAHEWVGNRRRFELWPNEAERAMDSRSISKIYEADKTAYPLRIPRDPAPLVVDIKGPTNIHPFSEFQSLHEVGDDTDLAINARIDREKVIEEFPELNEIEKMLKFGS